ncbi:cohesin domain-containing protein [Patescibacteria group bacterium]|nr:cohesin domain-containing protein [Patescibacteria group bacterium]
MKEGGSNKYLSIVFVVIVFFFALLFRAEPAFAGATIFFSPASPKVNAGDVFEMGVFVKSTDQAINACETEISFPTDKLEILSVSSKSSIFNLMVQNPTFSNQSGVINFSGVILNPGYTGSAGRLITLSFRAKNSGTVKLNFNSAQVLANDGLGTNVLSVASSASITIGQKKPEPIPEVLKPQPPPSEEVKKLSEEEKKIAEVSTTTPTTTPGAELAGEAIATSAIVLATSTACTYEQLPPIFIKIGGLNFETLGLLYILIIICIAIAIYAFAKAKYLEKQHHEHLHRILRKKIKNKK